MDNETFERLSALDFSSSSTQARSNRLFEDYQELNSGRKIDLDVQLITSLRKQHPELIVT
jgi:hypothetical protein